MGGGLWIERGPWGNGGQSQNGPIIHDDKPEPPDKLLNLPTMPSDYAEVDGPGTPLMPQQTIPLQNQNPSAPGTPVAYATTNIIRGRNVRFIVLNYILIFQ